MKSKYVIIASSIIDISNHFAQKMKQKPLRKLLKGDSKEAATILATGGIFNHFG
jgi:hypothetical protein